MSIDISSDPDYLRKKAQYEPIVRFVKGQLPVYTYHVNKEDLRNYIDKLNIQSGKSTTNESRSNTKNKSKSKSTTYKVNCGTKIIGK